MKRVQGGMAGSIRLFRCGPSPRGEIERRKMVSKVLCVFHVLISVHDEGDAMPNVVHVEMGDAGRIKDNDFAWLHGEYKP